MPKMNTLLDDIRKIETIIQNEKNKNHKQG